MRPYLANEYQHRGLPTLTNRVAQYASDREELEKLLLFLRKKKSGEYEDRIVNIWEQRVRTKHYESVTLITNLSEGYTETIHQRRIYCLTPHPDSTLMWSHYAENHKGVCLKFGMDNPLFKMVMEVVYPDKYPVWTPHTVEDDASTAAEMILTEARAWQYEDEFRPLSLYNNELDTPLSVSDGRFSLPPRCTEVNDRWM